MKKEILSELVTLRQLYEGRYVKYVKDYFVKSDSSRGYFVVFNDEGNKIFGELTNVINECNGKTLNVVYNLCGGLKDTKREFFERFGEQIALKFDDDKGKWLVNQVLIDYAESVILDNEPIELIRAKGLIEEMKNKRERFFFAFLTNPSDESNSSKLSQILLNNSKSAVFKYLFRRNLFGIVNETAIDQMLFLMNKARSPFEEKIPINRLFN